MEWCHAVGAFTRMVARHVHVNQSSPIIQYNNLRVWIVHCYNALFIVMHYASELHFVQVTVVTWTHNRATGIPLYECFLLADDGALRKLIDQLD